MSVPKVKPIDLKQYKSKQSKYDVAARLPFRSMVLGPSGSGKTIILQNLILDVYRDCFERIYIFSPSIDVDSTWLPVKKYINDVMNVHHSKDNPIYFSEYSPKDLQDIIKQQHDLIDYMKKKHHKEMFNILILVDDFGDNPKFSKHSNLMNSLFVRGRHTFISSICSCQVFNMLSPIIRKNITELYVYRLRNYKDLDSLLTELSALTDRATLLEIYHKATEEPYSFLYINLRATKLNDYFMIRFDQRIEIEDV